MDNSIWQRMQNIDRRVIYALLLVVIIIPSVRHPAFPSRSSPASSRRTSTTPSRHWLRTTRTQKTGDRGRLVVGGHTRREPVAGAGHPHAPDAAPHPLRHSLLRPAEQDDLTQQIVENLAPKYHYVYGQDYVIWGYRPQFRLPQTLKGIVNDIPGTPSRPTGKERRSANSR